MLRFISVCLFLFTLSVCSIAPLQTYFQRDVWVVYSIQKEGPATIEGVFTKESDSVDLANAISVTDKGKKTILVGRVRAPFNRIQALLK
jgi:hypothetical protein